VRWTSGRGAAALGAWLVSLTAFAGPGWSQTQGLLALATPEPLAESRPLLTTSFVDREPTDLRLIVTEGGRWRLMDVGASMSLTELEAKVTASGQLPHVVTEPVLPVMDLDESREPASLEVTARVGGFEAGTQYRSAGKRLEGLIQAPASYRDREGHEVWVAQRFGPLRLRLADAELTDNVDRNLALPRTTKDQTAVTAELGLDGWPVLGLTVASGDSTRVRLTGDGREGAPERHEFESATGSVYYYGGPAWSLSASSTLSRSRHADRPGDDMTLAHHDLSLTLHPYPSLTVTPRLGLGQERYDLTGLEVDTGAAGLTLSYAPPATRWWAWSYVGYTTTRAGDASTDVRSVSVVGALTYGLERWLPGCTVSVQAGYDHYVDTAVPESSAQAVSGFVLFKLAAF
jgi:hypothetical protein